MLMPAVWVQCKVGDRDQRWRHFRTASDAVRWYEQNGPQGVIPKLSDQAICQLRKYNAGTIDRSRIGNLEDKWAVSDEKPKGIPYEEPISVPKNGPYFAVGERIEAQKSGRGSWIAGKIMAVHDGAYDIKYDDGDTEGYVAADLVRKQAAPANRRSPPRHPRAPPAAEPRRSPSRVQATAAAPVAEASSGVRDRVFMETCPLPSRPSAGTKVSAPVARLAT